MLSKRPISYIVNTTFDPDHWGANDKLGDAGKNPTLAQRGLTGPGSREGGGGGNGPNRQEGAIIFSHENLLNRMSAPSGSESAVAFKMWPSNTFFTPKKTLTFNDEPIELLHVPATPPAKVADGAV